ncbi:MAG: hypothetical protein ABIR96_11505 [Bdellovibrionota bacterium]
MRLVASAPGKVVLFGEWAVLEGGPGVAIGVPPRLSVSWRMPSEKRDDATLVIRGDSQMALWDPNTPSEKQSQIPKFLQKTVKLVESLMLLDTVAEKALRSGGELRIERGWKIEEGLGSSSAIVAALLEIVSPDRERVEKWHLGRETIRRAQGGMASGLDLAAQLRGAAVSLVQDRPRPLNLDIPGELMFLHGGEKADTAEFLKENRVPREARLQLGKSCEKFLEKRDWVAAIDEHARILAEHDVWPPALRDLRREWLGSGLVRAMKSCGAGGGDTWILWSPTEKQAALQADATSRGYRLKRVEVATEGSRREKETPQ